MNLKEIFKHWLDLTISNIEQRNFNEINEELQSELEFARTNGFDPFEWCEACKIGICETHFEFKIFTPDDSYGIEN
jgi:hypothetical protein